jgi:hypothetical protein
VRGSWFATRCTGVSVINITALVVTVLPILPTLVKSVKTEGLLLAAARITKTHGWLLWDTAAAVLTATIVFVVSVAIVEPVLLLNRGVDATWGLLADGHAELLNICKLDLHCNKAVGLALHGFLHGGIRSTEVHE